MLSPGKILFTVLVIAAIFAIFKFVGRMAENQADRSAPTRKAKSNSRPKRQATGEAKTIEDMEECSVCGAYVASGSAKDCGRPGCPYA